MLVQSRPTICVQGPICFCIEPIGLTSVVILDVVYNLNTLTSYDDTNTPLTNVKLRDELTLTGGANKVPVNPAVEAYDAVAANDADVANDAVANVGAHEADVANDADNEFM